MSILLVVTLTLAPTLGRLVQAAVRGNEVRFYYSSGHQGTGCVSGFRFRVGLTESMFRLPGLGLLKELY